MACVFVSRQCVISTYIASGYPLLCGVLVSGVTIPLKETVLLAVQVNRS